MRTIDKIRQELKENGYNSRRVSVKSRNGRYDTSIEIIIKDITIPASAIHTITDKHESISYCEASGEILQGCNTFILISYDYDARQEAIRAKQAEADEIIAEFTANPGTGKKVYESNGNSLYYFAPDPDRGFKATVSLHNGKDFEGGNRAIYRNCDLAKALADTDLYGTLKAQ